MLSHKPRSAAGGLADSSNAMLKRLNDTPECKKAFKDVFGVDEIELEPVTKALATFQRTVVSSRSRFDQFIAGNKDALEDNTMRGLHRSARPPTATTARTSPTTSLTTSA
ncbi:MAG TPA: cytochrome c peroxidase [Tepidisphaeraceae bacterium]|jgi:cytochrome c peroxidase|nr:cytochrome c peroxidase [Tepidisphaeraceae bacterium]